mgnify:CR=1 FL=1
MPTIQDRYRLLNQIIDSALFKWHPDHYHGADPDAAQDMTRWLLGAKQTARNVYSSLTEAECAQIAADVEREG